MSDETMTATLGSIWTHPTFWKALRAINSLFAVISAARGDTLYAVYLMLWVIMCGQILRECGA